MWAKAAARLRGDTAHGVRAGVARGVGDTVHCTPLSLCMIDASDTPILSQGEPCLPPPPLRISPMDGPRVCEKSGRAGLGNKEAESGGWTRAHVLAVGGDLRGAGTADERED